MKIIGFAPVRQSPEVLTLFLQQMHLQGLQEVWAYDDNDDPASSDVLAADPVRVLDPIDGLPSAHYQRVYDSNPRKRWSGEAIDRVAIIKNQAITEFMATDATHLFLIDSDVLLRPDSVRHLLESRQPVIAGIYWTNWRTGLNSSPSDMRAGPNAFWYNRQTLRRLRTTPGHYQIRGTGACTLIDREVLAQGVDFTPTAEKPWGEDRWFCRRALDAGFTVWACNHIKPFHLYTDNQIPAARDWLAQ